MGILRKKNHLSVILPVIFITGIGAIIFLLQSCSSPVLVDSARIIGKQGTRYVVSPQICTPENPCTGRDMVREVTLYVDLNKNGYAVAYLQDQYGNFYNQAGKRFIQDLKSGSTKLYPGIPGKMDHSDFKLWIVTDDREIPTSTDSTPLPKLPKPSNGEQWGPIHLIFNKE